VVPRAPDKAYGWVSWGISPSGTMRNSDCLVGYGNPWQTAKARVRPYFLAGVKPEQVRPRGLQRRGTALSPCQHCVCPWCTRGPATAVAGAFPAGMSGAMGVPGPDGGFFGCAM